MERAIKTQIQHKKDLRLQAHTHTHKHTATQPHSHTHTQPHRATHTHTHTHSHTHTHTHIYIYIYISVRKRVVRIELFSYLGRIKEVSYKSKNNNCVECHASSWRPEFNLYFTFTGLRCYFNIYLFFPFLYNLRLQALQCRVEFIDAICQGLLHL